MSRNPCPAIENHRGDKESGEAVNHQVRRRPSTKKVKLEITSLDKDPLKLGQHNRERVIFLLNINGKFHREVADTGNMI